MKILCDIALPNSEEIFSQYGQVVLKKGREINFEDLIDVDVLIIRSITKVNEVLLSKANKLKFVGTATAGMDHLDTKLLDKLGIKYSNAEGSNCESVGDYILSVLLVLAQKYDFTFEGKSIGIIGCGHVGTQVENKAKALNLKIKKCDPLKFDKGDISCNSSLDEALDCDIVTLHVPMNKDGLYKTKYMVSKEKLLKLKTNCVFINASRGGVVNNNDLAEVLKIRKDLKVWLDVFEGEPTIDNHELLSLVDGATAHIAGYSFESKRRANVMLAKTMSETLNLKEPAIYTMPVPEVTSMEIGVIENLDLDLISRLVFSVYDVRRDSNKFKSNFVDGKSFDAMRQSYRERRELSSLTLLNVPKQYKDTLSLLGFNIK